MIDQEFVKYVVSALVEKPEAVQVERTVDDRGVLLTLQVDPDDLGRVIGRKGGNAQSLRTLLRALGSKNEAHYNLRIIDDSEKPHTSAVKSKLAQDNDFASPSVDTEDTADQPEAEESESSPDNLDKTKKELDDLGEDLF